MPAEDLQQDAKLQAVVLADSLDPNPKFRPVTLELPKVPRRTPYQRLILMSGAYATGECAHARLHHRTSRWERRGRDLRDSPPRPQEIQSPLDVGVLPITRHNGERTH